MAIKRDEGPIHATTWMTESIMLKNETRQKGHVLDDPFIRIYRIVKSTEQICGWPRPGERRGMVKVGVPFGINENVLKL